MQVSIYQVDAFTDQLFGGNPAAVCPLDSWLDDDTLKNIAIENNLAETAYFVKTKSGFHLRWFTPEVEMDLCGHATLASAHVIFEHLGFEGKAIEFETLSGVLVVVKNGSQLEMNFPSRKPTPATLPAIIQRSLSIQPFEVGKARDYLLVYQTEEEIRQLEVNAGVLAAINLGIGGIICTAKGEEVDFVSRFFTPGAAVFEDPATGSAHCSLIPYWSEKLAKRKLIAHQVSNRLGKFTCENLGERVLVAGSAVTFLQGKITI